MTIKYIWKFIILSISTIALVSCNGPQEGYQSDESSLCISIGKSDRKIQMPEKFKYKFSVNGVPFQLTKEELHSHDFKARRKIIKCEEPDLDRLSLKLTTNFSSAIKNKQFVNVELLPSRHGVLNSYQRWRLEHIKDLEIKPSSIGLISIDSTGYSPNYSSRDYLCANCNSFFGYPVVLKDDSKPRGENN